LDHLVAAPFIAERRAIPAPGGLRWLADARFADRSSGDGDPAARPAGADPSLSPG
jgi:hypothetical protein